MAEPIAQMSGVLDAVGNGADGRVVPNERDIEQ